MKGAEGTSGDASWLTRHRWTIIVVAIALLGLARRVQNLESLWLSSDEGIYYFIAHAPREAASLVASLNAHPPLFYLLLRLSSALFGADFLWLRLPSLVFGTLAIVAMARLGRREGGEAGGILAALLLALSPGAVMLSQVARPYAFQLFLIIGACTALLAYLDQRRRRDLWVYSGLLLVALFLHYSTLIVLGGIGLLLASLLLRRQFSRSEVRDLVLAHLPLLVAAVSLFVLHIRTTLMGSAMQARAVQDWLSTSFIASPADALQSLLDLSGFFVAPRFALLGAIVFLGGLAMGLLQGKRVQVGLIASILLMAIAFSAAGLYPLGGTRHSFYLLPFFLLAISYGARGIADQGAKRGAAVIALIVILTIGIEQLSVRTTPPLVAVRITPPEITIARNDVEELISHLEEVATTPGILIMDQATSSILEPVFLPSRLASSAESRGLPEFQWGKRTVVIARTWRLPVGPRQLEDPQHLLSLLPRLELQSPALMEAIETDMRILSSDAQQFQRQIKWLLSRNETRIFGDFFLNATFACVRLDPETYRKGLAGRGQ